MRRALLLLALAAAARARAQDPAIPSFAEETAPAGFTHAFTG